MGITNKEKKWDFFISYNHSDKILANELTKQLTKRGFDIFIDSESIQLGLSIPNSVSEGINYSTSYIIIHSKEYEESQWCLNELDAIMQKTITLNSRLFLYKIDDYNINNSFLNTKKHFKHTGNTSYLDLIDELLDIFDKKHNTEVSSSNIDNFIRNKYLIQNRLTNSFELEKAEEYSNFFKLIIKDKSLENSKNIFESIYEEIILSEKTIKARGSSEYIFPTVEIQGYPGSGKSFFLQLFYNYIFHQSNKEDIIPIYIDLDIYYMSKDIDEARSLLKNDLEQIKLMRNSLNANRYIFLIDGIDDYFRASEKLEKELELQIKTFTSTLIVIGLAISDRNYRTNDSRKVRDFWGLPIKELRIESIENLNTKFEDFVRLVFKVNDRTLDFFKNTLKLFRIQDLDFYLISSLLKYEPLLQNGRYETLSQFFEGIIKSELREKGIYSSENELEAIARLAFRFFVLREQISDIEKINNMRWLIVNKNFVMRDFLLAFHVIITLKKINNQNSIDQIIIEFNHVYPHDVNKYCKDLMNVDNLTQKNVFQGITKCYNLEISLTTKTHFSYLLGRFKNEDIKKGCLSFLINELTKILKNSNWELQNTEFNNEELLYIRTLFISLAYLNYKRASEQYLKILLVNKKWNSVNRGFHLEYYGDIQYDPGNDSEALKMEDNIGSFQRTFNQLTRRLEHNIKIADYSGIFKIELFTLCSLFQSRHLEHKKWVPENCTEKLKKILEKYLREDRTQGIVRDYFSMISEDTLDNKNLSHYTFLNSLYNLKKHKRSGWNFGGRIVSSTESIADHILLTMLIGKFYLPEKLEGAVGYSKSKIIDILLIHDIGESFTGDIVSLEKNSFQKSVEEKIIKKISLKSTYFDSIGGDVKNIYSDFKEFEEAEDSESINHQIAHDLDKIENLFQLILYYKEDNNSIPDFIEFKESLENSLLTEIGNKIKDLITKDILG